MEQAAEAIRGSSLPFFWMFLLGGPGETQETVSETLDFAQRTLRPGDVAYFNVGIRIYPGTELERHARREGVLSAAATEMLTPEFYVAPELDLQRTLYQVRRAVAQNLNLLHSASLSHPWLPVVNRWFSRLPLRGPLWRHTRAIRRGCDSWAGISNGPAGGWASPLRSSIQAANSKLKTKNSKLKPEVLMDQA